MSLAYEHTAITKNPNSDHTFSYFQVEKPVILDQTKRLEYNLFELSVNESRNYLRHFSGKIADVRVRSEHVEVFGRKHTITTEITNYTYYTRWYCFVSSVRIVSYAAQLLWLASCILVLRVAVP